MELEPQTQSASSDVSDAERQAAMTKQVTLAPLHDSIEPDAPSDQQLANRPIDPTPIPNVPGDSENTRPDQSAKNLQASTTQLVNQLSVRPWFVGAGSLAAAALIIVIYVFMFN